MQARPWDRVSVSPSVNGQNLGLLGEFNGGKELVTDCIIVKVVIPVIAL